jgi:hypothetical protein
VHVHVQGDTIALITPSESGFSSVVVERFSQDCPVDVRETDDTLLLDVIIMLLLLFC